MLRLTHCLSTLICRFRINGCGNGHRNLLFVELRETVIIFSSQLIMSWNCLKNPQADHNISIKCISTHSYASLLPHAKTWDFSVHQAKHAAAVSVILFWIAQRIRCKNDTETICDLPWHYKWCHQIFDNRAHYSLMFSCIMEFYIGCE